MYDAINRRDVEAALAFVDDDILYEDFNFPVPFKGKERVRKLFEESCDGIPDDMLFIVDECTDGGGLSVGMTWYVELEGEPFPNARVPPPAPSPDPDTHAGDGSTRWHRSVSDTTAMCSCCLLYTSPSPRDGLLSRMPSSA